MPKVRRAVLYGFAANLYAFQQCTNFENRIRFDKVTAREFKGGNFLRHSVDMVQ